MKYDLTWRYKYKIGTIDITEKVFEDLLIASRNGEPICLAPLFKINYNENLETIEITEISTIPLHIHRNKNLEL